MWDLDALFKTETVLDSYKSSTRTSLYGKISTVIWKQLSIQVLFGFISAILSFTPPFFLNKIITSLHCVQDPSGLLFLAAMLVCSVAKAVIDGQMVFFSNSVFHRTKDRFACACCSCWRNLRKDFETSDGWFLFTQSSSDETTQGKIVTLMSVDTEQIREFMSYLHDNLVRLPLSVLLAFGGLVVLLGWQAAGVGLGTLVVLGPLTSWLASVANSLQLQVMNVRTA